MRGDIVIAPPPSYYGKARPILVIQDDGFVLPSVTVLPFTSDSRDAPMFRMSLEPDAANGLRKTSQLMIDKAVARPRPKIGERAGRRDMVTMGMVNKALASFPGLGGAPAG